MASAPAPAQPSFSASCERTIDGLQIRPFADGLRIMRRWSRGAGYVKLVWVAIWFGVVRFFTSLGSPPATGEMIILALPGLAMFYAAMACFLNRTVIIVSPSEIIQSHAPLPWPGYRRFATSDINSLYIDVTIIQMRGYKVHVGSLFVVNPKGRKLRLMKGLGISEGEISVIGAALSDYLRVPIFSA